MILRNYRYESVAVLDGAIIMTLELVGARMIAPYFGSTIFVWTAVIGVILGALSLGYWYGGQLADRGASNRDLVKIMTFGALVLLVSLLMAPLSLELAASLGGGLRAQALVAAILLFAPFNVLAGIVSPYLAKLKLTSLSDAGSSMGRLYAAGTAGSILGTFVTGYWLIGLFGSRVLGLGLVVLLLGSSLLLSTRIWWWQRSILAMAAVAIMSWPHFAAAVPAGAVGSQLIYDGDSSYSRYLVRDSTYEGRRVRHLITDKLGAQSAIYPDDLQEPPFAYINRFMEMAAAGNPKRVLIIGGGTYTLPRLLADKYPDVRVDVVEIDPKLDDLAKQFFAFTPNPRITVIHEDGRTFLNANTRQYDLIYLDAFSSLTPPFTLTTTQAVEKLAASLTPEGAIGVNLVSAVEGSKAHFLLAELATYRSILPQVTLHYGGAGHTDSAVQNVMMTAGWSAKAVNRIGGGMKTSETGFAARGGQILTDDFAPVEHILQQGY
jgi:predicted membrane-bound spermidine synthase